MRISPIIVASLAIIWPALTAHSVAQQSTAAGSPNPASTDASPNDINGEQMFATTCGYCHQDGGRQAGRGPKLSSSSASKRARGATMPAYGSVFSDGQIVAIIAYIRGLDD